MNTRKLTVTSYRRGTRNGTVYPASFRVKRGIEILAIVRSTEVSDAWLHCRKYPQSAERKELVYQMIENGISREEIQDLIQRG